MKYWFTVRGSIPEESAQKLWSRIKQYKANVTVLFDKMYVYGTASSETIKLIENEISHTGFVFEGR